MIVAMYIKTESGDEYLSLFVDQTLEDIKTSLYDNMEMYEPVCNYDVRVAQTTDEDELHEMLSQWYSDSWAREE